VRPVFCVFVYVCAPVYIVYEFVCVDGDGCLCKWVCVFVMWCGLCLWCTCEGVVHIIHGYNVSYGVCDRWYACVSGVYINVHVSGVSSG
jgi:hypothetical protein